MTVPVHTCTVHITETHKDNIIINVYANLITTDKEKNVLQE